MPASPPLELEVFTAREMPRVVGSLALYCGDRDVAEELAQEALVRVCRDWEQVKAMEHPGAWLHRVAINLAHSHYRRRQAGRRARRRVEARAGVPALLPDTADALAVRDALARLPDRHRRVLVLRYWADLSMAETAVALDVSLSAAKSRASRATAALPAGGAQPLDQVANVIDRAGEVEEVVRLEGAADWGWTARAWDIGPDGTTYWVDAETRHVMARAPDGDTSRLTRAPLSLFEATDGRGVVTALQVGPDGRLYLTAPSFESNDLETDQTMVAIIDPVDGLVSLRHNDPTLLYGMVFADGYGWQPHGPRRWQPIVAMDAAQVLDGGTRRSSEFTSELAPDGLALDLPQPGMTRPPPTRGRCGHATAPRTPSTCRGPWPSTATRCPTATRPLASV